MKRVLIKTEFVRVYTWAWLLKDANGRLSIKITKRSEAPKTIAPTPTNA